MKPYHNFYAEAVQKRRKNLKTRYFGIEYAEGLETELWYGSNEELRQFAKGYTTMVDLLNNKSREDFRDISQRMIESDRIITYSIIEQKGETRDKKEWKAYAVRSNNDTIVIYFQTMLELFMFFEGYIVGMYFMHRMNDEQFKKVADDARSLYDCLSQTIGEKEERKAEEDKKAQAIALDLLNSHVGALMDNNKSK